MNAAMLEVQDLLLRVGERTLVRELSFRIPAGEVWCMLGPNGAGKTTFLHTVVGLREPQGGAVRLAGRALGDWPAVEAARQRGFLPQTFHDAFSASVIDCVMLGRHPYLSRWQWEDEGDREIVREALVAVDLAGFAQRRRPTTWARRSFELFALAQPPSRDRARGTAYGRPVRLHSLRARARGR